MPLLALPALAVLAALLCLLILLGGQYIGKLVAQLVPDWSIPKLGSLRGAVLAGIDWAMGAVFSVLDAAVAPVAKLISYPVTWIKTLWDITQIVITELAVTIRWVVITAIPRAIGVFRGEVITRLQSVVNYATRIGEAATAFTIGRVAALRLDLLGKITQAIHYATAVGAAVTAWATREFAAAEALTVHRITQAIDFSKALVAAAIVTLRAEIGAVSVFAHAAYADTLGRIADALRTAETFAVAESVAAADAAITGLEIGVEDAFAATRTAVAAGVGAVDDVLGIDLPDIGELIRSIDLSRVGDIAGDLAMVGALDVVMLKYLERCGIPNCRNLGGLGRDLQALFQLVEGVALFELIREMISDPRGAAHNIESGLGGIANGAISAAQDLLGVG